MQLRTRIDDSAQDMTVEALANIYTPSYRMMAVVREYVSNAIDAQRDAGCEDPVRLDIKDDDQRLTITVEDQGYGMDRETLERVYVHISLSDKRDSEDAIGGFGIGAKAAHSLGGTLMVTSDTGTQAHRLLATRDTVTGGIVNELTEIESTGSSGTTVVVDSESVHHGPIRQFLTLLSLTSRVRITGDFAPAHQYQDSGVFRTGHLASEVAERLGVDESRLFAVPAGVPGSWLSEFDIVAGVPVPTRLSETRGWRGIYDPSLAELCMDTFRPGVFLAADVSSDYALPRSREALLSATTGEKVAEATTTRISDAELAALSDIAERELGDLLNGDLRIDPDVYDRWTPQDRVILASILSAVDNAGEVAVYRARKAGLPGSYYQQAAGANTDTGRLVKSGIPLPNSAAAVLDRTPRMARPTATKSVPTRVREAVQASTLPESPETLVIDAFDPADRQRAAVAVGLMYLGTPAVVTRPSSRARSAAVFTAHRVGGGVETRTIEEWVSLLESGSILGGSTAEFMERYVHARATAEMGQLRVEASYRILLSKCAGEVYASMPGSLPIYRFESAPSAVARAYRKRIEQTRKTVQQEVAGNSAFLIDREAVFASLAAQMEKYLSKEGIIDAAVSSSDRKLADPYSHTRPDDLFREKGVSRNYTGSVTLLRAGAPIRPELRVSAYSTVWNMRGVVIPISLAVRGGDLSAASAREVLEAVIESSPEPENTGISYSEACQLLDGLRSGDIPLTHAVTLVS